jgi:PAS domain S-box-containing protein
MQIIKLWNEAMARMTGYPRQDMMSLQIMDLLPTPSQETLRKGLLHSESDRPAAFTLQLWSNDDQLIDMEVKLWARTNVWGVQQGRSLSVFAAQHE